MSNLKKITVALAGNPNCGKTTLFNAITGARQKVGNYPGVTVEKKEGDRIFGNYQMHFVDLPGTYSLTAYSLDEVVARDFLITEKPDIIIDVIDSTNLERNLFLCLQFQELGIPMVGALNMSDQAEGRGIKIDAVQLSTVLQLPLVKTIGTSGNGVELLLAEVVKVVEGQTTKKALVSYGKEIEKEVEKIVPLLAKETGFNEKYPLHWFAVKLLEKDNEAVRLLSTHSEQKNIEQQVEKSRDWLGKHFGMDAEIAVSEQRYGYIHGAVSETVKKVIFDRQHITEKVDSILINRFLGLPIFLFILWSIFSLTFSIGEYPMGWLESFFGWLGEFTSAHMADGLLKSLLVDGIIGGVGGVFSFVPLIVILFMLLSILEDTGYMVRAAFVTDKFLHVFGLHGQSFMPMILGFGCSVPAIMAARTLKNPRDRILTVLITPFMSCGAKLPVYILLAGAFFPAHADTAVMLIYIFGVVLALLSAFVLQKTILRGNSTPFVMELPPYRMPTFNGIFWHVWDKTKSYIQKAGTTILAASVIIWAITTFPEYKMTTADIEQAKIENIEPELFLAHKSMENSYAGQIGKVIEPVIAPVGFDWKIGISLITGFAAKEVVVSTLGILYSVGTEEEAESSTLRDKLAADKNFTPVVAIVLMLFTLILAPCIATLSTIKAELGWKWLGFSIAYTSVLAWGIGFTVFQIGSLIF